jgi:hypothetical protein
MMSTQPMIADDDKVADATSVTIMSSKVAFAEHVSHIGGRAGERVMVTGLANGSRWVAAVGEGAPRLSRGPPAAARTRSRAGAGNRGV